MTQADLFAPPEDRRCGTCVTRNARNEDQPLGSCPRTGGDRRHDDAACGEWFGLTQLRSPLYGRGRA